MSTSSWFQYARRVANPRLRLICFPYAGANAGLAVFREWANGLPEDIEIAVMELPGRGRRFGEPLISRLPDVISELNMSLQPLIDRPYAFFGHSIGALIAFELVRALVTRGGRLPEVLMVSGKRAPQLPHDHRLHLLPDPELIEALENYNGTPAAVLRNKELMDLLLPVLRADFSLAETYVYRSGARLECPIHAFGGREDSGVEEASLRDWHIHAARSFHLDMFDGDHFFIQGAGRVATARRVADLLERWCPQLSRRKTVFA